VCCHTTTMQDIWGIPMSNVSLSYAKQGSAGYCVAVSCNELQCNAVICSELRCVATLRPCKVFGVYQWATQGYHTPTKVVCCSELQ